MKLDFTLPNDNKRHDFCLVCHQEALKALKRGAEQWFVCQACGNKSPRALIIDPEVKWYLDASKNYWHETAGVLVCNPHGEFLFFKRIKFPFGLTVPAGHLNRKEQPFKAAKRELFEEVGLKANALKHLFSEKSAIDSCRRGADHHLWHTFGLKLSSTPVITVTDEGTDPVWLSPEKALQRQLTPIVRYLLVRYRSQLAKFVS